MAKVKQTVKKTVRKRVRKTGGSSGYKTCSVCHGSGRVRKR